MLDGYRFPSSPRRRAPQSFKRRVQVFGRTLREIGEWYCDLQPKALGARDADFVDTLRPKTRRRWGPRAGRGAVVGAAARAGALRLALGCGGRPSRAGARRDRSRRRRRARLRRRRRRRDRAGPPSARRHPRQPRRRRSGGAATVSQFQRPICFCLGVSRRTPAVSARGAGDPAQQLGSARAAGVGRGGEGETAELARYRRPVRLCHLRGGNPLCRADAR